MDAKDEVKTLSRTRTEPSSPGPWQTVGEFSQPGTAGCPPRAAQQVGEIFVDTLIPDQVRVDAAGAVRGAIENELSGLAANQAPDLYHPNPGAGAKRIGDVRARIRWHGDAWAEGELGVLSHRTDDRPRGGR